MFIEKFRNNGKDYLRLVHAVRKSNKNGDMVSTKKVLLNIGTLDRFDDGQPDYVAIPYTTGSKRGLETRVPLKKALAELGFKGGIRSETERNQWVAAEKLCPVFYSGRHREKVL